MPSVVKKPSARRASARTIAAARSHSCIPSSCCHRATMVSTGSDGAATTCCPTSLGPPPKKPFRTLPAASTATSAAFPRSHCAGASCPRQISSGRPHCSHHGCAGCCSTLTAGTSCDCRMPRASVACSPTLTAVNVRRQSMPVMLMVSILLLALLI